MMHYILISLAVCGGVLVANIISHFWSMFFNRQKIATSSYNIQELIKE